MTPCKKSIYILPSNVATLKICSARLSYLKPVQANYIMTAFNSKGRHEKLPTAVHVLQSTCDFVISNCAQVLQRNVQLELFKAWARNVKYNLLWLGIYISCYSCFTKLNFSLIIKRDILALPYYFDHAKWFFFVQRRGKGGGERPAFTLC